MTNEASVAGNKIKDAMPRFTKSSSEVAIYTEFLYHDPLLQNYKTLHLGTIY
jgi:hypothetical protein